jgi:hypothetical protein
VAEVRKSNLRAELIAAEAQARAKKRKAAGLPVEDEPTVAVAAIEDEETNKRRKVLQEALEMDKDAYSDDDDDADGPTEGEAKCVTHRVFFSILHRTYVYVFLNTRRTAEAMPRKAKTAVMVPGAMVPMVVTMTWRRKRTRTRTMRMTTPQSCSGSSRR